ncbi:hypothetical protein [Halopiger xanaduensis]|uniref:Pectate lyase superfamily protein domain-containing protein n=1 Tax=Halopiger xanaduensis (strain DSM 18323 / JCM 14033 / SH-6) TaxID=797210 RepID=F8D6L9_HALXS|nr:hypothetical protein [Halopiger xanaduensis]AEH37759.1 hypothetical protein Halxa_3146 [Halopiger xanaduensis SH-6]
MSDYPEPPRTDWGDFAVLSDAANPEDYEDRWGRVQDEENWRGLQDQIVVPFESYADFPAEGPFDGARAEAKDMNVIFEWDADTGDWRPANTGTTENPVPGTTHLERADISEVNNAFVARDSDELQAVIDRAADSAGWEKKATVHLVPDKTYRISETIYLREGVCLLPNNATIVPDADTDILFIDTGTKISGPLTIKTRVYDGYSSTVLVADGARSTTQWYRSNADSHFRLDGPIHLHGEKGEGTGLLLKSAAGEYIIHCSGRLNIRGYDTAIRTDTTEGGFVNGNYFSVVITRSTNGIVTSGPSGGKLILYGHIQCNDMEVAIRNEGPDHINNYGPFFVGHLEDPHRMADGGLIIDGPNIKVREGYSRLSGGMEWNLGPGSTFNGYGAHEGNSRPDPTRYTEGEYVRWTDTADGDVKYLMRAPKNMWFQIAAGSDEL